MRKMVSEPFAACLRTKWRRRILASRGTLPLEFVMIFDRRCLLSAPFFLTYTICKVRSADLDPTPIGRRYCIVQTVVVVAN
jgi:hypothetical protein